MDAARPALLGGSGVVLQRVQRPHHCVVVAHFVGGVQLARPQVVAHRHLLGRAALGHDLARPRVEAGMGGSDDQHQARHAGRISRGMGHRHHAAVGSADRDDGPEAERHAQGLHVLDVLVQRVARRVAAGRTSLAAVVEVDQLHRVGQRAEGGLEAGVVASRAAVDDEGHRPLAHVRPVGHQAGALDVEVDLGVADLQSHRESPAGAAGWGDASLSSPAGRAPRRAGSPARPARR